MKYLLIAVVFFLWMGCKKDKLDRHIEILGYNYDASLYISNGSYVTNTSIKQHTRYEFDIKGNTEASVSVLSMKQGSAMQGTKDTLNEGFRLVIISNKQTIYDKYGSNHHYRF